MKKKNKKKLLIIPIILILLIVLGIGIYLYKDYNTIDYKEKLSIKIGQKVPNIKDIVKKEDLKKVKTIKWKNLKTEKNKVYNSGNYTGTMKFKKKTYKVTLKVLDDEAPTIEGVKDIEIFINDKVDLLKDIKTKDNSKDKVETKIDGKYDLTKKGEYKLKVIAIDKSKNKSEKEFKLIVKEKPKVETVTPSTPTTNKATTTSKGYKVEQRNGIYYIDGILIANKTYNLPSNYNPGGLLGEFTSNFNRMKADASSQGVNLWIKSGFRSYASQSSIYNNYVARDGRANADTYSARPGHSEHQSGLAADINSLDQSWINTKEGQWLNNNCSKYGFIIRYPRGKEGITGYIYEPWHIRYVGTNLSSKLYNNGNWITIEEYFGITSKY